MNASKKFILVAEDDKAYASVYKSKLESEGYEVIAVENGNLALSEMRKRKPDLLILDLVMPEKSGFEVLEELRGDTTLKKIKVIIASNLSQDEDRKKVKELGISDYFVKSDISITEMVERIEKVLLGLPE